MWAVDDEAMGLFERARAWLGKVGGFGATEAQETAFLLLGRAAPRGGDRRTGCDPPTALVCPKPVHLSSSFASALQVRNCIVGDSTIQGTLSGRRAGDDPSPRREHVTGLVRAAVREAAVKSRKDDRMRSCPT